LSVARADHDVADDCVCHGALLGVLLGIDDLFAEVPRVDGIGVFPRAVRNEVSIAWKNEHENEKKSERDRGMMSAKMWESEHIIIIT